MGAVNTQQSLENHFATAAPALVVTSGFAGALNPDFAVGQVLVEADDSFPLKLRLLGAGARPARFHCATTIAVTAQEKTALRERTRADAVEMESAIIHQFCRTRGVSCATVRVISDGASETLPLDFGALMDARTKVSLSKLAWALCLRPWKIPALRRFHRQIKAAAASLAHVLAQACDQSSP